MFTRRCLKKSLLTIICLLSIVSYLGFTTFHTSEHQHTDDNVKLEEFASFDILTNDSVVTCSNLGEIRILKLLGHGYYKRAYVATFRGAKVVVKMGKITQEKPFITSTMGTEKSARLAFICLQVFHQNRHKHIEELLRVVKNQCHVEHIKHMLVEIIYHAIVKSVDGIVKQLGFCVQSPGTFKDSQGSSLLVSAKKMDTDIITEDDSIVSVYEYGDRINDKITKRLAYEETVARIRRIATTIVQLKHTLVGPLAVIDTRFEHVASVDGKWKMFDLGIFESGDVPCNRKNEKYTKYMLKILKKGLSEGDMCPYSVPCVDGVCKGLLEKLNHVLFCKHFIRYIRDDVTKNELLHGAKCEEVSMEDFAVARPKVILV